MKKLFLVCLVVVGLSATTIDKTIDKKLEKLDYSVFKSRCDVKYTFYKYYTNGLLLKLSDLLIHLSKLGLNEDEEMRVFLGYLNYYMTNFDYTESLMLKKYEAYKAKHKKK